MRRARRTTGREWPCPRRARRACRSWRSPWRLPRRSGRDRRAPRMRAVARLPATTQSRRSRQPEAQLARSREQLPAQRNADVAAPEGDAGEKVRVHRPFLIVDNSAVIGTQDALIHARELAARHPEVAEI